MKKLFLTLFLVLPLSLHAMDSTSRFLIAGTAALAVGIGGNKLANAFALASYGKLHLDLQNKDVTFAVLNEGLAKQHELAKQRYVKRSALVGVARSSSYIFAKLLAHYAVVGKLPAYNVPMYVSELAVVAGSGLLEFSGTKRDFEGKPSRAATIALLSGASLLAAGSYGLYRNS